MLVTLGNCWSLLGTERGPVFVMCPPSESLSLNPCLDGDHCMLRTFCEMFWQLLQLFPQSPPQNTCWRQCAERSSSSRSSLLKDWYAPHVEALRILPSRRTSNATKTSEMLAFREETFVYQHQVPRAKNVLVRTALHAGKSQNIKTTSQALPV